MTKFSCKSYFLTAVILILSLQRVSTLREISGLLDEVEGLTNAEVSALRPLFEELQLQYDFVVSQAAQETFLTDEQYDLTLKELEEELNKILRQKKVTTTYTTSLPTLREIIGSPDLSLMTTNQRLEFLDLKAILQETLDDAETNLRELEARALKLETSLLQLSKPKMLTLIFKALQIGYKATARIGRAAYCAYSHLPQLNTFLQSLYEGVDCYKYTTTLMLKIQNEGQQTVKTIRRNIFELAGVYKKVAAQNSLMGKIVTVVMNITIIATNILTTIQKAQHALDEIENQLPAAVVKAVNCGTHVAPQISFVLETISNVTECIVFKDETTTSYDFFKSKEEDNKNIYNALTDIAEDEENADESK